MAVDYWAHATAEVEDGAHIGARTRIWARSHIRSGASIGVDCVLGEGVFVDTGVTIGARCKVQNGCQLYQGLHAGDGVFFGPGVCITNDRKPRAVKPDGMLMSPADWSIAPVHVEDGASLGACCVVVAGCTIGPHAVVGAGAVVTRDVPAHGLVFGNPARFRGWVCICGERLDGELRCGECGRAYREHEGGIHATG